MRTFRQIVESELKVKGDSWLYNLTDAVKALSKAKYNDKFLVLRDKEVSDIDKHTGMRWDIVDKAVVDNVKVFAINDIRHYDDRTPQINVQRALRDIGAEKFNKGQ